MVEVFTATTDSFREVKTEGWDYTLSFEYALDEVRCLGWRFCARLSFSEGKVVGVKYKDGKTLVEVQQTKEFLIDDIIDELR